MTLSIRGLGVACPPHLMTQQQGAALAERMGDLDSRQARLLRVLYRKSGVNQRHTCLPHEIALNWAPAPRVPGPLAAAESRAGELAGEHAGEHAERATAVATLPPATGADSGADSGAAQSLPSTEDRMRWYEQFAAPLAEQAARAALEQGDVDVSEITHLVTVSCTGFYSPGVDVSLIRELGLPATTERTNVGFMGCHGAVNGLRVAHGFGQNPANRVLVCAVELCSLHFDFQWDEKPFLGSSLFADGAAAVVARGGNQPGGLGQIVATGSCLIPDSEQEMSWRIGDEGFRMTLTPRVPELIESHLRPWLAQWLAQQDLRLQDVESWVVHPGGPRIVQAVETALELSPEATAVSREVLREYGNMSSPTVLFILDRLARQRGPRRGPTVVLGFGPGLVAETLLLR